MAPKIDDHDIETKIKAAARFLDEGDKLKVTVRFRGREMAHPDRGRALLLAVGDKLKDHGIIERMPLLEGRQMIMVMNPVRAPQIQNAPGGVAGSAGPAPLAQPASSPAPSAVRPGAAVPPAHAPSAARLAPAARPAAAAPRASTPTAAAPTPARPAPTRPPSGNRVH
jgi:translation initiation factor IF-3-like protein